MQMNPRQGPVWKLYNGLPAHWGSISYAQDTVQREGLFASIWIIGLDACYCIASAFFFLKQIISFKKLSSSMIIECRRWLIVAGATLKGMYIITDWNGWWKATVVSPAVRQRSLQPDGLVLGLTPCGSAFLCFHNRWCSPGTSNNSHTPLQLPVFQWDVQDEASPWGPRPDVHLPVHSEKQALLSNNLTKCFGTSNFPNLWSSQ